MKLLLLIALVLSTQAFQIVDDGDFRRVNSLLKADNTPIAILVGFNSYCGNATGFQTILSSKLDRHNECFELSPDPEYEAAAEYSMVTPIREQGARACELINANPKFQGEFDLLGFSQGTVVSRYLIQYCNLNGKIRNFIAFGGPLNGISSPPCGNWDLICTIKNWIANYQAFTENFASSSAPASYLRFPQYFQRYLDYSPFLAEANNEVNYSEDRRQKFLALHKALFIKFAQEQVVIPAESSWWGEFDRAGNVLSRNQTRTYNEDLIGIKTLEEQGRGVFVTLAGKHVEVTPNDIDEVVIPFLTT